MPQAFKNAYEEYWNGYQAALEDAERAFLDGKIGLDWFAEVRRIFNIPEPDGPDGPDESN